MSLSIVVCVKDVPDTAGDRHLSGDDSTVDREGAEGVVNWLDEIAIETGLSISEANEGSTVTVLTMGPEKATESIRRALAMGADSAVHVVDDALHGSDGLQTSYVLAEAIKRQNPDLVVLGTESTDARMGTMAAMLAERLGIAQLSMADSVEVSESTVRVKRQTDQGFDLVEGDMPALISVMDGVNEPRYPSFKGIMAAKKKTIEELSLADLSLESAQVGQANAATAVTEFEAAPPRPPGVKVTDEEGQGGAQLGAFFAERKFI